LSRRASGSRVLTNQIISLPPPLRFVELPDDVPRDGVAQERRHGHLE
jgi:hypothetical protein